MARLGDLVDRVRSKNAGPFTVTLDVFCGSEDAFGMVAGLLSNSAVADVFRIALKDLDRHELPNLNVIKFSFPRPHVQGSRLDRDMHAAQFAALLEEMQVPDR